MLELITGEEVHRPFYKEEGGTRIKEVTDSRQKMREKSSHWMYLWNYSYQICRH